MKKFAFGLMAVAGLAASAMASTASTTFTSYGTASFTNKDSIAIQGTAGNAADVWTFGAGGTVNAIRVTGTLNKIISGTYASEARVRMSAGAGNAFTAFNLQATTTGSYTGPLSIGPAQFSVTPFTLAAGDVNFEWFESYDDGAGADSNWGDVSYEFGNGSTTIVNGGTAFGTIAHSAPTTHYEGSHVSGGLDFFTFDFAGVSGGYDYLNIRLGAGLAGTMDTEVALYDAGGNLVWTDDDGGAGLFSQLSFGSGDPLSAPDLAAGASGLSLAAGSYTIVTGGYNTNFTPLMANIVAGTAAGGYSMDITYAPAPGALALLGLGGLVAGRRRR